MWDTDEEDHVRRTGIVIVAAAALLLAACGGSDDVAGETAGDTAGDGGGGDTAATTVATATTDLGEVLVDGEGLTLYLFDSDPDGGTACTDGCAETWPPLDGPAEAGTGVDGALLGTIERPDGTTQATYAGHPLYLYAPDAEPGDVLGQGVGEVWWVLDADGAAVRETAPAATSGPAY